MVSSRWRSCGEPEGGGRQNKTLGLAPPPEEGQAPPLVVQLSPPPTASPLPGYRSRWISATLEPPGAALICVTPPPPSTNPAPHPAAPSDVKRSDPVLPLNIRWNQSNRRQVLSAGATERRRSGITRPPPPRWAGSGGPGGLDALGVRLNRVDSGKSVNNRHGRRAPAQRHKQDLQESPGFFPLFYSSFKRQKFFFFFFFMIGALCCRGR